MHGVFFNAPPQCKSPRKSDKCLSQHVTWWNAVKICIFFHWNVVPRVRVSSPTGKLVNCNKIPTDTKSPTEYYQRCTMHVLKTRGMCSVASSIQQWCHDERDNGTPQQKQLKFNNSLIRAKMSRKEPTNTSPCLLAIQSSPLQAPKLLISLRRLRCLCLLGYLVPTSAS